MTPTPMWFEWRLETRVGVPINHLGLFGLGFFINFLGRNLSTHGGRIRPHWDSLLLWAPDDTGGHGHCPSPLLPRARLPRDSHRLREASSAPSSKPAGNDPGIPLAQRASWHPHWEDPRRRPGSRRSRSYSAPREPPLYGCRQLCPEAHDQFMDLGYHTHGCHPVAQYRTDAADLFATVLVLLAPHLSLNALAILVRARLRLHLAGDRLIWIRYLPPIRVPESSRPGNLRSPRWSQTRDSPSTTGWFVRSTSPGNPAQSSDGLLPGHPDAESRACSAASTG